MSIKLAIVDDDIHLAKSLMNDLIHFKEIGSVLLSSSGLSFVKELQKISPEKIPEVIIMDISMNLPDEGILATRSIKNIFPDIHIIIFTISDEDNFVFEAFKAGAMGYLLKNEPPSFILKTILDVKNGGAQMSPVIARKTIRFFSLPQNSKVPAHQPENHEGLSVRETEILAEVAKGTGYAQIAEKLFISVHTVKKHMINVFRKLHVKNKIEALKRMENLK